MKFDYETLGMLLFFIGAFTVGLATVSGIGYFLYLWGSLSGALGASMWAAFLLWIKMVVGGLIIAIGGLMIGGM